jgi:hypothetical protein
LEKKKAQAWVFGEDEDAGWKEGFEEEAQEGKEKADGLVWRLRRVWT